MRALANAFCDSSPSTFRKPELPSLSFRKTQWEGGGVKLAQLAGCLTSCNSGCRALTQLTDLFLENIRCDVIVF